MTPANPSEVAHPKLARPEGPQSHNRKTVCDEERWQKTERLDDCRSLQARNARSTMGRATKTTCGPSAPSEPSLQNAGNGEAICVAEDSEFAEKKFIGEIESVPFSIDFHWIVIPLDSWLILDASRLAIE
jgi:hypothetical protein